VARSSSSSISKRYRSQEAVGRTLPSEQNEVAGFPSGDLVVLCLGVFVFRKDACFLPTASCSCLLPSASCLLIYLGLAATGSCSCRRSTGRESEAIT
jgi:hypothetical protein